MATSAPPNPEPSPLVVPPARPTAAPPHRGPSGRALARGGAPAPAAPAPPGVPDTPGTPAKEV